MLRTFCGDALVGGDHCERTLRTTGGVDVPVKVQEYGNGGSRRDQLPLHLVLIRIITEGTDAWNDADGVMAIYEAEDPKSQRRAIQWSLQLRQEHGARPTIMVADQTDLTDMPTPRTTGPVEWADFKEITTENPGEVLPVFNQLVM